jgi:hypothetical protein
VPCLYPANPRFYPADERNRALLLPAVGLPVAATDGDLNWWYGKIKGRAPITTIVRPIIPIAPIVRPIIASVVWPIIASVVWPIIIIGHVVWPIIPIASVVWPIIPIASVVWPIIAVATPLVITTVVLVISPPASLRRGRQQGESAHECCHQNGKGTCSHVLLYTRDNPEYSKMLRFVFAFLVRFR